MLPVGCDTSKDVDSTVWHKAKPGAFDDYIAREKENRRLKDLKNDLQETFNEKCKNCTYPQRKGVPAKIDVEGKEYTVIAYAKSYPGEDDYYIDLQYYKVYVGDKIFYGRNVKHYQNDDDLHITEIGGYNKVIVRGNYIIETKLAKHIDKEDFQKRIEEVKKQYEADLKAYEDCLSKNMPELPKELYHRMSRYDY